ncbi:hypothetical protein [uncultured Megasphaera sp.]|uniref:hypothetical protein n=1 Tax=uncultured Megasphaera sp. TaxID=165188 RepID=UPI00265B46E3|nr:hypothetical protein [uncultured Megasphaera sp.]
MNTTEQFIKTYHIQTLRGTDDFKKEFSVHDWSAPVIQNPDQLNEYIHRIGLIGAAIQEVTTVSPPCLLPPVNHDSLTVEFDNVLVIITDRGAFEISYSESSSVCISKNRIPKRLYYKNENSSMDNLQLLFSYLKGDSITDISIKSQSFDEADFEFTGSFGIYLEENLPAYIKEFRLLLKSKRQLAFTSYFDWGVLSLLDEDGEFETLKSLDDVNHHCNCSKTCNSVEDVMESRNT